MLEAELILLSWDNSGGCFGKLAVVKMKKELQGTWWEISSVKVGEPFFLHQFAAPAICII